MIDIDSRVSPTLHPKVFGDPNESSIVHAAGQFEIAYSALRKLHDARTEAYRSSLLTKDAATLKVAALADKTQITLTKSVDSARKAIQSSIDALRIELQKPFSDDGARVNAEIRSHVKALPYTERVAFVTAAIASGDHKTLRAVLGGPAYLSGLEAPTQAALTQQANLARDPERAGRLDQLEHAMKRVDAVNLLLVMEQIEKGLGTSWDAVKKLRAKQERLERALS